MVRPFGGGFRIRTMIPVRYSRGWSHIFSWGTMLLFPNTAKHLMLHNYAMKFHEIPLNPMKSAWNQHFLMVKSHKITISWVNHQQTTVAFSGRLLHMRLNAVQVHLNLFVVAVTIASTYPHEYIPYIYIYTHKIGFYGITWSLKW